MLERIVTAIIAGQFVVPIAATFPVEQVRDAVGLQSAGHVHGKVGHHPRPLLSRWQRGRRTRCAARGQSRAAHRNGYGSRARSTPPWRRRPGALPFLPGVRDRLVDAGY
jgi:hypothetical protein